MPKSVDKGNYKNLKTLESWHTSITDEADNNSNTLPGKRVNISRFDIRPAHDLMIGMFSIDEWQVTQDL